VGELSANAPNQRDRLRASDHGRCTPRRWFIVLNQVQRDLGAGDPLPHRHCARCFKVKVYGCAGQGDQFVNRGVTTMLDAAGTFLTVMHGHRNLFNPSARADHDVDGFATGKSNHGIERITKRKPGDGQCSNADGQVVEFSALYDTHLFMVIAPFVYVNLR
jgi:hypothetical protein